MTALQAMVTGVALIVIAIVWCAVVDPAAWEADLGTVLLAVLGITFGVAGVSKAVVK